MNRDPALHGEDADQFNPARHLDENGKMKIVPDTKEENHLAYGFGRRLCLGRFVANNQMFIQMALLLWCVNVEQATDEKGNKIPLDIEGAYENGLAVYVFLSEFVLG
jgi:cytochrome P450